jgi:hypothetical protein
MTNDELRESIQNHKEYSILKQDSSLLYKQEQMTKLDEAIILQHSSVPHPDRVIRAGLLIVGYSFWSFLVILPVRNHTEVDPPHSSSSSIPGSPSFSVR